VELLFTVFTWASPFILVAGLQPRSCLVLCRVGPEWRRELRRESPEVSLEFFCRVRAFSGPKVPVFWVFVRCWRRLWSSHRHGLWWAQRSMDTPRDARSSQTKNDLPGKRTMKLLISPADVCLLRSYERFRQIVPISSDALARRLFRILSSKLTGFGDCSASDQTEQMADVPVRLYQLLFALGYCQQVDPVGNVVPLVDKKTGVARCAPPKPYAPRNWQGLGQGNRDWERQRAMLDTNGHHYRELATAYREWARHGIGSAGYLDEDKRQKIRDKALAYKRQLQNALLAQKASQKYRKVDEETAAEERRHLLEMARQNLANNGIDAEKMLSDLDRVQADQAELHHDALHNVRFRAANVSTARASILREDPRLRRAAEIQKGIERAGLAVAPTPAGASARPQAAAAESEQWPPAHWSPERLEMWHRMESQVLENRRELEQKQRNAKLEVDRAKEAMEERRRLAGIAKGSKEAADQNEEIFQARKAELAREEEAAKAEHVRAEEELKAREHAATEHKAALARSEDIEPSRQNADALLAESKNPVARRKMSVAEWEWAQQHHAGLEATEAAKAEKTRRADAAERAGKAREAHLAEAASIQHDREQAIERHAAAMRDLREAEAHHAKQVRQHEEAERNLEAHRSAF